MLFQDAVPLLQKGSVIARENWKDTYLILMRGLNDLWKINVNVVPVGQNYSPTIQDLLADDWQVLQ